MSTIRITVEVDQSLIETLSPIQRQKLCRQVRQEQVKRYYEWASDSTHGNTTEGGKKLANKKGFGVNFEQSVRLLEAAERFDNQEGVYILVFETICKVVACAQ